MIKKAVKKLWKGEYVSVRDYEVLDAINRGGMCIIHNGDIMKLTPDQLKDLEPQENVFKSQFNSGTYRLVDIFWKPQ
jgi:hypothetical protein